MKTDQRALDTASLNGLAAVAIALALLLMSALAYWVDERMLNDISVWSKPMKFNLSFALHMVTMVWLWQLIAPAVRDRRAAQWLLPLAALSSLAELLYISLQAARGRHSHFNFDTPLEYYLYYGFMGGAAFLIVGLTFCQGLLVWRYPRGPLGRGLHAGAALGLTLGAVATLVTAGALASGALGAPGHWVGAVRSDSAGLPLLGWSTTGGDLRVPHFFATHLTQALPLLGWLADRGQATRADRWVWAGAGLGVAIVIATFVQAASGRALLTWVLTS